MLSIKMLIIIFLLLLHQEIIAFGLKKSEQIGDIDDESMEKLLASLKILQVQTIDLTNDNKMNLQNDINDFWSLLPIDELKNLTLIYYTNNMEVHSACDYMKGKEFSAIREHIYNLKEVKDFVNYLDKYGVHVIELVDKLADLLRPPALKSSIKTLNASSSGGLNTLFDDIFDLLPQDEIVSLFFDKLETSTEFGILVEKLGSEEFDNIVDSLKKSKELQGILSRLRYHGVDVDRCFKIIQGFFGLGF